MHLTQDNLIQKNRKVDAEEFGIDISKIQILRHKTWLNETNPMHRTGNIIPDE